MIRLALSIFCMGIGLAHAQPLTGNETFEVTGVTSTGAPSGQTRTITTGDVGSAVTVLVPSAITPLPLSVAVGGAGSLVDGFRSIVDADDSMSISRCTAAGVTCRFAGRNYVVNSPVALTVPLNWIGTAGAKIIQTADLPASSTNAWFRFSGSSATVDGIIFDAQGHGATNNTWCLRADATVTRLVWRNNSILNCGGTLGFGFLLAGDANPADNPFYSFENAEFGGNAQSGLRISQALDASIRNPLTHNNGQHGIDINYFLGSDTNLNQRVDIDGGFAYSNHFSGVSVGNFNQGVVNGTIYGNGKPSAAYVRIRGMVSYNNLAYGFQAVNNRVDLIDVTSTGNAFGQPVSNLTGGGGVQFASVGGKITGSTIENNGYYCIDAGGSTGSLIANDVIDGCSQMVNLGASVHTIVTGNKMFNFTDQAVNIPNTDGNGSVTGAFPQVTADCSIDNNDIDMSNLSLTSYAVYLVDGVQGCAVTNNRFRFSQTAYNAGMRATLAMLALTDNITVEGNKATMPIRAGATTQLTMGDIYDVNPSGSSNWLVVPDVLNAVRTSSGATIGNLSSYTTFNHSGGEVSWVVMTAAGSGYNPSTTVCGFTGTFTTAPTCTVAVWNGTVIGVVMVTRGVGATGAIGVTITDTSGAGSGATATAQIGTPIARNARVRLYAKAAITVNVTGSLTTQSNPTGTNLAIPIGGVADFIEQGQFVGAGAGGAWNVTGYTH